MFQESLIGRKQGPLVMIVAVNPSSHEFDETLRTLKYSAVAKELVPVQSKPALPRKSAAVYDLDGRLKKRRRPSEASDDLSVSTGGAVTRSRSRAQSRADASGALSGGGGIVAAAMRRDKAKALVEEEGAVKAEEEEEEVVAQQPEDEQIVGEVREARAVAEKINAQLLQNKDTKIVRHLFFVLELWRLVANGLNCDTRLFCFLLDGSEE